jgi:hypothetical protein
MRSARQSAHVRNGIQSFAALYEQQLLRVRAIVARLREQ